MTCGFCHVAGFDEGALDFCGAGVVDRALACGVLRALLLCGRGGSTAGVRHGDAGCKGSCEKKGGGKESAWPHEDGDLA